MERIEKDLKDYSDKTGYLHEDWKAFTEVKVQVERLIKTVEKFEKKENFPNYKKQEE